jgi:hypothetical protein
MCAVRASLLLAAVLGAGCGGGIVIGDIDLDCDEEIVAMSGTHGPPDASERRFEGDVHLDTFFYWRSGFGITFAWGGGLGCERRDFPIERQGVAGAS